MLGEIATLGGYLAPSVGSHLIGRVIDASLEEPKRKKHAYELIENTLNRFIEDKKARLRFKSDDPVLLNYRLTQILYGLYDDVITIIVTTDGLVDEKITEQLRELTSHIANVFNKITFDFKTRDKLTVIESMRKYWESDEGYLQNIESIEENQIKPILKEVEETI